MSDGPASNEVDYSEQAAFADHIVELLAPVIQQIMKDVPPPKGNVMAGMTGFFQAFTHIELSLFHACKVPPMELVKAFRLVANDIENAVLQQALQDDLAAPSTPTPKVDF